MDEAEPTQSINTQLFRDAFNASPIGIAVENLDGQPLFVNPALCSVLGFSEDELRGKHCVQFSPPDDAEKDWALFQQLRAGSIDHYQLEKRYFRRDGSQFWGRLSLSLLNHRPSPLVLAMVEDITEKKTAEEARLRHAAIVESSEDAIVSGTLDGIVVSWNAGAQRIYGYTEKEAMGKPITILVPPELPDEENKILEMLKAGRRIEHFETVRVTKTGERINVSLTISPIKDASGRTVGISGIARDVTGRKLAEEALRESEEKFRNVFRDAGVGMVIVSPEGRFLAANGTFCDCLGYTEEELLVKTVESVTFPDDWPAFSQKLVEAITKGIGLWRFQKRCIHKSGRIVYTESSASLIRNRNGEPQYFVGEVLDITKPKEAEEALSDMTRKLVEAQEQERARIARELHDDINQRLSMLAVELEQLQDNSAEVRSRVQELRKQTIEISNDVQALSHDLHSSKLEYLGVVAAIKSWYKEFGKRQKLEIDFRSDVSSACSPGIGLALFRVLQEAVHNAAKHSGVSQLGVQLHEESNQIHLIVTDLGRGFDVEAALQGKGLGLTSIRERIRLLNGTVAIDSKPMGGTTIHVRVPFKSEQGSQRAAG
jgi:PAS domain S-box-containing protein